MNMIIGTAAMTSASAITKAEAASDAALVVQAEQIAELSRRWDVAIERWGECHDRYVEMRGHKPETLLWKPGSPVRQATGQFYHKDGKTYPWCCTDEIEEFRHKTFFQYMFVGPGRMSEQRTSKFLDENWPVEGWERWPDEVRQKRFSKLLAEYDEWVAADRAAREMSGVDAAEMAVADCESDVRQAYDRMLAITPTTLEGYRAMATACAIACWDGEIDPVGKGAEMIAKILAALTGLPIVQDDSRRFGPGT